MSKRITLLITTLLLLTFYNSKAQVFWVDDFSNGCTSLCTTYTGPNGAWTVVATGTNDTYANTWFFSETERGVGRGVCGTSGSDPSLHVGSVAGSPSSALCPSGDCGAAYDAGLGSNQVVTNKRCQSPVINCTGKSNITLSFNYIMDGQAGFDYGTVWYYDGTTWALLASPAITAKCGAQGKWTYYSVNLPASANGNPAVQIGFNWQNNDDAAGSDPSFAVDSVQLSVPVVGTPPIADFTATDSVVCAGDTVYFVDKSTNATSWSWTFTGGTPAASTLQNPKVVYGAAGNYTVKEVVKNSSGSDSLTKVAFIKVVAKPVVTLSGTTTICSGSSTTITATGGGTYTWTPITGLSCTNCAVTIATPTATTTYSLSVSNGTCIKDTTIKITVNPSPTVSVTPNPATICNGGSVGLTASGATSYTWTPATALTCTNCSNPTANPSSTTTYTVVGTTGGCTDTVKEVVNVNTTPTVSVTPPSATICSGASVGLTASGATSYTWLPVTGLSSTNTAATTASPTTTTTYTVTGANGGCTATQTVTITVNTSPTVSVTPSPATICNGGSVGLTASGATSYSWTPVTALTCTNCANPTANPTVTTTYTVVGTTGTCTDTATVVVNVNTTPTVSVTPPSATICSGASVGLTASGATSYTWLPATGLSSTNTAATTASPTATTTYTVTGANGGCTGTQTVTITVNTSPTVSVLPAAASICSGNSVGLTASGATTYTWSPVTGLSSTNTAATTANPTATTTYSVIGTTGGCTDTTAVVVTVNATPTVSVLPTAPTICAGGSIVINASGASTYAWSPAAGLSCINCASTTANPAATTTYTLVGTSAAGGCTDTIKVTVTVGSAITVTVSGKDSICSGGAGTTLTANGATSYTWNPGTGLSSTNTAAVTANPASTTTYTVTGTSGSCSNTATVTVTVTAPPTITVSPASPGLCVGSSVGLTASGATSYTWSPATGLTCTNCTNPTANPASTTTYTITGTTNGCTGTTTDTVKVATKPVPGISNGDTICAGVSVGLSATGGTSYVWSTGATTSNITVSPALTNEYKVTISNGPCSVKDSVTITVNPAPFVAISPVGPLTIVTGTGGVPILATPSQKYAWAPAAGLSCTACQNPTANPSATTEYTLTVTDTTTGCTSVDSILIIVQENCGNVFVPDAFSPNGDGQNDVLFVRGICIETIDFIIYDRWGNKIFETQNPLTGWDGTRNGTPMNAGTYAYYVQATTSQGKTVTQHGNVTLVR